MWLHVENWLLWWGVSLLALLYMILYFGTLRSMYVVDFILQRLVYWIDVIRGVSWNVCKDHWIHIKLELMCRVSHVISHSVDVSWLILDTISKSFFPHGKANKTRRSSFTNPVFRPTNVTRYPRRKYDQ